ncbi:MAG: hypothetical protein RBR24_01640 [Candidatus Carbobacillus sp.]|nr:hypothetical protein [Candidatus Carbobacillus sp.]
MTNRLDLLRALGLPVYKRQQTTNGLKQPDLFRATVFVTPNERTVIDIQAPQTKVFLKHDPSRLLPKRSLLLDTAWRAAYMLGLSTCYVELLYTGAKWQITAITPVQRAIQHDPDYLHRPMLLSQSSTDEEHALTLGVDIEALIVRNDKTIVMASDVFPREGEIGTDGLMYRDQRGFGHYPVLEIRLKPKRTAEALFDTLRQTLVSLQHQLEQKFPDASSNFALYAGCAPHPHFSLGGHVHARGVKLTMDGLRRFDLYLALPLLALAPRTCAARLKRYGYLGDIRFKRHGGFEYRTLPSWMVDPWLTRYVLLIWEALVRTMVRDERDHTSSLFLNDPTPLWHPLAHHLAHFDPSSEEDVQRLRRLASLVMKDLEDRLHEEWNRRLVYAEASFASGKEAWHLEASPQLMASVQWVRKRLQEGWRWEDKTNILPLWLMLE